MTPDVRALAEATVPRSLPAQLDAGAVAARVCEPPANALFISPFILGPECDVLHVPGGGETILREVEAMLTEAA